MIIGLVPVFIVTVMFTCILNFVHCEITACDSDSKQSLILSYLKSNGPQSSPISTSIWTASCP